MAGMFAIFALAVVFFAWSIKPLLEERKAAPEDMEPRSEKRTAFTEKELETDFNLDRINREDLAALLGRTEKGIKQDEKEND